MRLARVIGALALCLTATGVAACGSDDGSDGGSDGGSASGNYCEELKSGKALFGSLDSSDPDLSQLDEIFDRMHTLADDAPAAVESDWKTLDEAVTTIQKGLAEAGLTPSDLEAMQNGQIPSGADLAKLQELTPKLEALSSAEVSDAAQRIADNAKDTCDIDLQAE
jgi:hypothetical protein